MVIVRAFEIPEVIFITFRAAPAGTLLLCFAAVFLLVLVNMTRKMGRISIRGFLDMEKQNEEKILRSSRKRNILFCASLLLGILGFLVWNSQFSLDAGSDQSVMYWLMLGILLFILSIYGVSVSAGDMLLTLVLRKRSLKYTGDHLFIARTFSSKVRSMSITMGTLSMLVVLTLLSLNVSYLYQGMSGYLLELESPYDIQVFDDPEDREILSDYIALAEEDYTVRSSYLFDVYKDPGMHLQPIISVPGSNTDFDTVISLGTYNELLKLRGLSPVSLEEDGYLILTDRQLIPRFEEAEEDLSTLTLVSRLGVSGSSLCRTVGRQLLILFGLPVAYPVLITFLCMFSINRLYSIFLSSRWVYLEYFLAGLGIFLLVYLIYFIATYIGFKRNIQEA